MMLNDVIFNFIIKMNFKFEFWLTDKNRDSEGVARRDPNRVTVH